MGYCVYLNGYGIHVLNMITKASLKIDVFGSVPVSSIKREIELTFKGCFDVKIGCIPSCRPLTNSLYDGILTQTKHK